MDFKDHEKQGREKYERICRYPHKFTEGVYDKWDVSSTGKTRTYNIEIKNRDIPFEQYANGGFMLEKNKYDALLDAFVETGSIPVYMNFFAGGQAFWINLTKLTDPKWTYEYCTATTANNSYGKKRVPKLVTFIPADKVRRFSYE